MGERETPFQVQEEKRARIEKKTETKRIDLTMRREILRRLSRSIFDRLLLKRGEIKNTEQEMVVIQKEIDKLTQQEESRLERLDFTSEEREGVDMLFINPPTPERSDYRAWGPSKKEWVFNYHQESVSGPVFEKNKGAIATNDSAAYSRMLDEWLGKAIKDRTKTTDDLRFVLYSSDRAAEGNGGQNCSQSGIRYFLERQGIDLEKLRHPDSDEYTSDRSTGIDFYPEMKPGEKIPGLPIVARGGERGDRQKIKESGLSQFVKSEAYKNGTTMKSIDVNLRRYDFVKGSNGRLDDHARARVNFYREPGNYGKTVVEVEVSYISKDFLGQRLTPTSEK